MIKLVAKYRNKINWYNLSEWNYSTASYSLGESIYDNKTTLTKLNASGSLDITSGFLLTPKTKRYRISFEIEADRNLGFSGGVKFLAGSYTSSNYTIAGQYSFVTNISTTDNNFIIRALNTTDKWSIKDLVIEELLHQPLDLFEDNLIALTFQVSDIENYSNKTGVYSKQFNVPGTDNNNKFFRNIFEINQLQKFNINSKCDAELYSDEYNFYSGYLKLDDILDNNGVIEYIVTFYGENLNLFADIGDDTIDSLSCPELNHKVTTARIVDSWQFPNSTLLPNIVYPYIDYGTNNNTGDLQGFIGKAIDQTPSLGIIASDLYPAISVKYLIDKIFNKYGYTYTSDYFNGSIVEKMIIPYNNPLEDLYGWHLATRARFYGSSFTNLAMTDFNNNLLSTSISIANDGKFGGAQMKYDKDGILHSYNPENPSMPKWIIPEVEIYKRFNYGVYKYVNATHPPSYPINSQIPSTSPIRIPNPNNYQIYGPNTIRGAYRCAHVGNYKAVIRWKVNNITSIDGSGTYVPGLRLYGGKLNENNIQYIGGQINNESWKIIDPTDQYSVLLREIHTLGATSYMTETLTFNNCEEGDLLFFKIGHFGNVYGTEVQVDYIEVYEFGYGENVDLTYKQILPKELKIKDFLKDLMLLSNLYIDVDKNNPKNLIIEPRDVYYAGGSVKDWSSKLDLGSEISYIHPNQFPSYINKLTYVEESDYHNQLYNVVKDTQKLGYAGKRFINESDLVSGESTVSLNSFAPTVLRNEWKVRGFTSKYQFVTSAMWNAPYPSEPLSIDKKTNWKPRILFFKNTTIFDNGYPTDALKTKFNFNGTRRLTYPYAGHIDTPFDMTNAIDLNFDTRLRSSNVWQLMFNGYPDGQVTKHNMFNNFYLKQFKQMTDKNTRLMTANFQLNTSDIIDFKMSDSIFVNNAYFLVNKIIDFNPDSNNLTRVELIKLDSNITGDFETIEYVPADDNIVIKPIPDGLVAIDFGVSNFIASNNSAIIMGNNNTAGNNSFITGNNNYTGDNTAVINSNNTNVSEGNTVINSDNVNISNDITGTVIINSNNIENIQPNSTYIGNTQITEGIIFNNNLLLDGGNIEVDGVYNPYKNIEGTMINDCGENGTQIDYINAFITVDAGSI